MTSSPQQPDKVPVSVYLPLDLKASLEGEARKNGRTVSAEIRVAVERYLKRTTHYDAIEVLPEDEQLIVKTLSQQAAKRATIEVLRQAGLPIPPDLKREFEEE